MKTYELVIQERTLHIEVKKHHWAKQMSMRVMRSGQVKITIPRYGTYRQALAFVEAKGDWLAETVPRTASLLKPQQPTTQQRRQARQLVERKLQLWNQSLGLRWNAVYIRNQSTRWGSCSAQGNLSFNWRIIKLPKELQDYLIVHELAHLKEHNHSPRFWTEVEAVLPDYKTLRQALKHINPN